MGSPVLRLYVHQLGPQLKRETYNSDQLTSVYSKMQVRDAVCLVTGSAQGLGRAFAIRLLAAGAKVCISDVREEGGLATLEELREKFGKEKVTFVQCDVTKQEQFTKYVWFNLFSI